MIRYKALNFDDDKDDIDEEMKERIISDLEFKVKYLSKEIDSLNEIITNLKTKSN